LDKLRLAFGGSIPNPAFCLANWRAPARAFVPVEPGARVCGFTWGQGGRWPISWQVCTYGPFCTQYFLLYILYLVFSIASDPAQCANICRVTCGQTDLWLLFGQEYFVFCIVYIISCVFYYNGPSPLCQHL